MLYFLLALVLVLLFFWWLSRGDREYIEELKLGKRKADAEWAELSNMSRDEVQIWLHHNPAERQLWCEEVWRKRGIR